MSTCRCGCRQPATQLGLAHACYERSRYHGQPGAIIAAIGRGNDRLRPARLEDYAELRSEYRETLAAAAARVGISERTAWRYEAELRRAAGRAITTRSAAA